MMPGTVCITTHGSRPEGMFCSSSSEMVVDVPVLFVSMIGVAAVTLTVSAAPATESRTFSGVDEPAATTTSVFVYGLNPDRLVLRSEEHTSELQSRPHLVCR